MAQFVDECNIHVKAGDGGAGNVAFRREAHVPKGGPDGGDGGDGGDVWLVANRNVASLVSFQDRPFRRAADGVHGQGKRRHGRSGADTVVQVPVGTVVVERESDEVLADLVAEGDRFLVAEGGRGGRGNARFLSNQRRAPGFAEQGEVGDEFWRRLELKLVADVALVGFPNVGKSTLISRISAAKPKVADYPFTTLVPNLGVVRLREGREDDFEYVVADVPGLIEGASDGRGLGHQFLRHVERARALCVLVDMAGASSGSAQTGYTPAQQLDVLLEELAAYQPDLLDRPRLVVGSRADLTDPVADSAGGDGGVDPVVDLAVSSVTGAGVRELKGRLADAVREAHISLPAPAQFVVHRPAPEDVTIAREGGAWVVHGRDARRAVALSDLTRPDALAEAHRRLKSLGVDRALARAGAQPGEVVRIGGLEFDYSDDELF